MNTNNQVQVLFQKLIIYTQMELKCQDQICQMVGCITVLLPHMTEESSSSAESLQTRDQCWYSTQKMDHSLMALLYSMTQIMLYAPFSIAPCMMVGPLFWQHLVGTQILIREEYLITHLLMYGKKVSIGAVHILRLQLFLICDHPPPSLQELYLVNNPTTAIVFMKKKL